MNYTYILQCSDNTYYTGWTNDLEKRIDAHNSKKGAKYTKSRLPVTLVYYETFQSKEEAMRREWEIKRLSRSQKEALMKESKYKKTPCD
jgi:putative endonuclease